MRKIKRIELLQAKEKLKRKHSATRLEEINADQKKCSNIYSELGALVDASASKKESLSSSLYISERAIIHQMMEQKEIVTNRLEFLQDEKKIIVEELNRSEFKDKVFKKRKEKLTKDKFKRKQILVDDELSSIKRT